MYRTVMLTSKEKSLVIRAYYSGVADSAISFGVNIEASKEAYKHSCKKLMNELGLIISDKHDLRDFLRELEVVA